MDSLLIWKLISLVLSSIPLYFALKLLGSRNAGIIRVVLVNVLVGAAVSGIDAYFNPGNSLFNVTANVLSFLAILFIYKEMFELGWLSAFLAWLLEIIIVVVILALVIVLGIAAIVL